MAGTSTETGARDDIGADDPSMRVMSIDWTPCRSIHSDESPVPWQIRTGIRALVTCLQVAGPDHAG